MKALYLTQVEDIGFVAADEDKVKVLCVPGDILGFNAEGDVVARSLPENIVSVVAQRDLDPFLPVTIQGELANSSNTGHFGKVIGLTLVGVIVGFIVNVITSGLITNPNWSWSPGGLVFLNSSVLSATPPTIGFSQAIGVAKTSDTIFVSLTNPILL